jgi:hypothetical protein
MGYGLDTTGSGYGPLAKYFEYATHIWTPNTAGNILMIKYWLLKKNYVACGHSNSTG